jgi:hypothetical protein
VARAEFATKHAGAAEEQLKAAELSKRVAFLERELELARQSGAAAAAASVAPTAGAHSGDAGEALAALQSRLAIAEERHAIELASARKERDEVTEELTQLQTKLDKQKKKHASEVAALREEVRVRVAMGMGHMVRGGLTDGVTRVQLAHASAAATTAAVATTAAASTAPAAKPVSGSIVMVSLSGGWSLETERE